MRKIKILWTDDEIDLLKPHIQFLKEKGYEISTATNGDDTIELVKNNFYDLIFFYFYMNFLPQLYKLK